MRALYNGAIYLYYFFIRLSAPFYAKAKMWIDGRKNWEDNLRRHCFEKENIILFHCASLGEFEQGKPLMKRIKEQFAATNIMVTFFSPSGYEVIKDDPIADIVTYLPIDTPVNAKKFVDIVNPQALFFIKYEFWFNLIDQLAKKNIPFYFVSTVFRKSQPFFKPYGKWFAEKLKKTSFFFVQNDTSKELLHTIGIDSVEIVGDTRFDRVNEIAKKPIKLDIIEQFKADAPLIIAGSTWPADEKLLVDLFQKLPQHYKLIIAPHQVDEKHIEEIEKLFDASQSIRYSECMKSSISGSRVLIIDTIGLLSRLYSYGRVAYVGGGFRTGLHNILEAVVFGIPVFFGPDYKKFNEAQSLVNLQGGFPINSSREMLEKITFFDGDEEEYRRVCFLCSHFVQQNLGATEKIVERYFLQSGH